MRRTAPIAGTGRRGRSWRSAGVVGAVIAGGAALPERGRRRRRRCTAVHRGRRRRRQRAIGRIAPGRQRRRPRQARLEGRLARAGVRPRARHARQERLPALLGLVAVGGGALRSGEEGLGLLARRSRLGRPGRLRGAAARDDSERSERSKDVPVTRETSVHAFLQEAARRDGPARPAPDLQSLSWRRPRKRITQSARSSRRRDSIGRSRRSRARRAAHRASARRPECPCAWPHP